MAQHTSDPLSVSSLTLAASDLALLARLAATASTQLEQSVSKSAIMRALIRSYRSDHPAAHRALLREVTAGNVWGTVPASRRPKPAAIHTPTTKK